MKWYDVKVGDGNFPTKYDGGTFTAPTENRLVNAGKNLTLEQTKTNTGPQPLNVNNTPIRNVYGKNQDFKSDTTAPGDKLDPSDIYHQKTVNPTAPNLKPEPKQAPHTSMDGGSMQSRLEAFRNGGSWNR
ncbi:hypothetical protein [Chromobacterium haemolyticum]|uniref:hypothetical protein n=1 Tax=Chromobacterium haemolyticum TaxID=394935 RepID=UPI001177CD80|nr:hypothetical protein [Chromobacterium haemolyticum]